MLVEVSVGDEADDDSLAGYSMRGGLEHAGKFGVLKVSAIVMFYALCGV